MSTISGEILFEKFEILDVLKKDEHSGVFLANHIYLGKKIILKALNTHTTLDESKKERFKREAKVLAKLDHPNIIKVLDFGTYNEYFYISFEYFKSENLRTFCKNNNLSVHQKDNIEAQILKGLCYSHSNNIIHRDLKPENILINDSHHVKVSDFGLALEISDTFITRQYSIVGTPCYMSPEQLKGEKLTIQSDLFSLGIVLFELYTGINPFLGKDINQSITNIINYKEENIADRIKSLPERQREVIGRLLRKNKSDRYSNVDEILNQFGISQEKSIEREGESVPQKKWNKKYIAASAAAVAIIITAFVLFSLNSATSNSNPKQDVKVNNTPALVTNDKENHNNSTDKIPVESVSENNENEPSESSDNQSPEIGNDKEAEKILTPGKGSLFIECVPWAYVYIDSIKIETTPLDEPIVLNSGVHHIKLQHPDFPSYEARITIDKERTTNLKVNLDTLFGYYDCKIFPWAEIYINGKLVDRSPLRRPLKLFPGKHEVILKNPQFAAINDIVHITKRDTLVKQYRFEK